MPVDSHEIFIMQNFSEKLSKPLVLLDHKEKAPHEVPKFLAMSDLQKKSMEELELDEYVMLSKILLNKEDFQPLPPKEQDPQPLPAYVEEPLLVDPIEP